MDGEISIIHSFSEGKISDPALHVHCVLYCVLQSHSCLAYSRCQTFVSQLTVTSDATREFADDKCSSQYMAYTVL